MAKFKIEWMEKKTSAGGKEYAKTTVTNEANETKENVAIFGTFPGFAELMPGHLVEAELVEKDYNGSKSYSLFPPKPAGGGRGGMNMDRVMEKKANLIGEAQSRKEQSINAAQDRSAWMWAKNSAANLIASEKYLEKNLGIAELADRVNKLATEIYLMEPTKPF